MTVLILEDGIHPDEHRRVLEVVDQLRAKVDLQTAEISLLTKQRDEFLSERDEYAQRAITAENTADDVIGRGYGDDAYILALEEKVASAEKAAALQKSLADGFSSALMAAETDLAALRRRVEELHTLVLRLWDEETLSEGQAAAALGVERVEARGMLHDYRAALASPPVAAQGAREAEAKRRGTCVSCGKRRVLHPEKVGDDFCAECVADSAKETEHLLTKQPDAPGREIKKCPTHADCLLEEGHNGPCTPP